MAAMDFSSGAKLQSFRGRISRLKLQKSHPALQALLMANWQNPGPPSASTWRISPRPPAGRWTGRRDASGLVECLLMIRPCPPGASRVEGTRSAV